MTSSEAWSLKETLEGAVWLGFLSSQLALILLLLENVKSLQVGFTWLPVTLGFWIFVFYATTAVALGLIVHALVRFTVPRVGRISFGILGTGFLTVLILKNRDLIVRPPIPESAGLFTYLVIPWFVITVTGLVLLFTWPASRGYVRGTGFLTIILLAAALVPYATPVTSVDRPAEVNTVRKPVLFLGLDGADWGYVEPLIRQGKLPNLAELRRRSAWGALETIKPTKSPAIWTTIATGEPPVEHGITQFVGNRLTGGTANFARIRPVEGIGLSQWLPSILKLGRSLHGGNRHEAAYWEIASSFDHSMLMINWWMSWPASPLQGWMVTERVHTRSFGSLKRPDEQSRVTFPPSLRDRVQSVRYTPDDLTYEDVRNFMEVSRREFREMKSTSWRKHQLKSEFKYMYSMFETNRRLVDKLLPAAREELKPPVDLFVVFRLLDIAGHTALRYSDLTPSHPSVDPADERKFDTVVTRAYRAIDRVIGNILERRQGGYVFVVSDHGFQYNPDAQNSSSLFDHNDAPEGIWMLSGPGVRSGFKKRLSIYDVLPVLARVKGFPLSLDWKHGVPDSIFEDSFKGNRESLIINSYDENYRANPTVDRSNWDDRVFKNRLKALGYLE